jgi:hypothetical protein
MIVGPRIIFDKSFVQGLNGDLIDEMTLYFTMTCPPTLISEIIADLTMLPLKGGRIGRDIVRQLAAKMKGAHGAQPPPLRSLVLGSLHGQSPPMDGYTLPVMVGMPGVRADPTGRAFMVSQIPQQQMWARLASGDFRTDDEIAASAWREGIDETNLEVERKRWIPLANQLGNPTTLARVVEAVDRVMLDPSARTQRDLIHVALDIVRGSAAEKLSAVAYFFAQQLGTTLSAYAPFAAHAVRLYFSFSLGMARGFIGTRSTNTIDLQYLLYAPFCRVFVSNDKLHRMLWKAGAVTSKGEFVAGDVLRSDLKNRNDRRRAMTEGEWEAHRAVHGQWPESIEGSIVSSLWERHCPDWPRGGDVSPNVGKTIEELDPHLRDLIRRVMELSENGSD